MVWQAFRQRTIFGFHGNTRSRIEEARQNGFQRDGRDGDWLGGGFYFWLDAPARAWDWADEVVNQTASDPEQPSGMPGVIVAALEFNQYWIDLIELSPWFARFKKAAADMLADGILPDQRDAVALKTLSKKALHKRDYALIEKAMNDARLAGIRVDAIRCAFIEGLPVVDHSALFDLAHVQIVMRNAEIMLAEEDIGREMWE